MIRRVLDQVPKSSGGGREGGGGVSVGGGNLKDMLSSIIKGGLGGTNINNTNTGEKGLENKQVIDPDFFNTPKIPLDNQVKKKKRRPKKENTSTENMKGDHSTADAGRIVVADNRQGGGGGDRGTGGGGEGRGGGRGNRGSRGKGFSGRGRGGEGGQGGKIEVTV